MPLSPSRGIDLKGCLNSEGGVESYTLLVLFRHTNLILLCFFLMGSKVILHTTLVFMTQGGLCG